MVEDDKLNSPPYGVDCFYLFDHGHSRAYLPVSGSGLFCMYMEQAENPIESRQNLKSNIMDIKLYVIKGKENAGKTSTCWNLLHKLKEHIECVEYWELRSAAGAYLDSERQVYINQEEKTCDFVIVFTTKITHRKIAIISAGDEAWLLKKDIFFVLSKDVTLIVCCSRTINRQNSTAHMIETSFKQHVAWSDEITFVNGDIILKQKYEEEISETIYQQFKESLL